MVAWPISAWMFPHIRAIVPLLLGGVGLLSFVRDALARDLTMWPFGAAAWIAVIVCAYAGAWVRFVLARDGGRSFH